SGPSTTVKPLMAMRRMPMSSVEAWWTSPKYSLSVKTRPTWANRVTAMTSAAPEHGEDLNRRMSSIRQRERSSTCTTPTVTTSPAPARAYRGDHECDPDLGQRPAGPAALDDPVDQSGDCDDGQELAGDVQLPLTLRAGVGEYNGADHGRHDAEDERGQEDPPP